MSFPTIALIGRPNVGKSTLFNALSGERKAIVSDKSGTTRDRLVSRVDPKDEFGPLEKGVPYYLVDTAGLSNAKAESLEEEVKAQVEIAREKADLILFVLDGKKDLTLDDQDILQLLRKRTKDVILLANKLDDGSTDRVLEWSALGFGEVVPVSGKNFFGVWELQDKLQQKLQAKGFETPSPTEEDPSVINLALLGRPNVGKSSLFNALLGQSRSVVSDVSGTTRDTIDEMMEDDQGQTYRLLDCAGLRRPGKIGRQNIEYWSSIRTTQAIDRADICIVLIDALEGVTHQDLAIVSRVLEVGAGLILGINKFDLVREKSKGEESDERELEEIPMWGEDLDDIRKSYLAYLQQKITFLSWAPILFFSAKTGRGINDILTSVRAAASERRKRIPTSELNQWAQEVYHSHVIPSQGKRRGKIKYASQVDTAPPKLLFFANNKDLFHFSYKRYLENKLREKYGFFGTPVEIEFRDAMKERRENRDN